MKLNYMKLNRIKYLIFTSMFLLVQTFQSYGEIVDRIVAIVNDEAITASEVKRESYFLIEEAKNKYPLNEQKEKIKYISGKILDELIKQKLQLQKAKEIGISVSDENVTSAIEEQRKEYSLTEQQFLESLKKENMTLDEYRKKIFEQITILTLINHVVKPKIFFTSKEFKEYYDTNLDFFKVPGTVHLQQILIKLPADATSEDLKNYDSKIYEIFSTKKNDEDLKKIAEKFVKEGLNAEILDMGVFTKEELATEFAKAFSLNTGDFTFVRTKSAYHILYAVNKKNDFIKPFSEVKDQIEDILYNNKKDRIYQDYLKELEEAAYIEKRDLD